MPLAMWELRHNSVQTSEPGLFDTFRRSVSILLAQPGAAGLHSFFAML